MVRNGKKGTIKIPYVFHVKHLQGKCRVVPVFCGFVRFPMVFGVCSFNGCPRQPRAPAVRVPIGAPAPPPPPSASLRSAASSGRRGAACCVPVVFGLNCGRCAPALTASATRPAGRADARPRAPLCMCSYWILKGFFLAIAVSVLYICMSSLR